MGAFRVVPAEVVGLAGEIERTSPFAGLADSARLIRMPEHASASSAALGRFKHRLAADLTGLATAAGSLGRATRSAAAGYQQTDDLIRSISVR